MIITGGVNVYPQEAENVLALHPKVADVAVLGVPNEDFGEEVKAVVEPISMDDAGPELERELIAYCREHLADVKCPRSVDFRPELPAPPHRQALQAPAQGRVLGGPRQRHHLSSYTSGPAAGLRSAARRAASARRSRPRASATRSPPPRPPASTASTTGRSGPAPGSR